MVKNPSANAEDARDAGSTPGSERSPGGGHGSPLQYSCLENPVDRGGRWASVHGVAESDMTDVTQHSTQSHTDLFLGFLSCFVDLCVCFCAGTILF